MKGETHLIGGWAMALAVDHWFVEVASRGEVLHVLGIPISQGLVAAAIVGFGALLPDIDEPHSIVSNLPKYSEQMMPSARSRDAVDIAARDLIKAVATFLNLLVQMLSKLVRFLAGGHRGATHWLLTGAILTFFAWLLGKAFLLPQIPMWFGIGYFSHIFFDMLTVRGLKSMRPFFKRTLHLLPKALRVSTGELAEQGIRTGMIIMSVILLFS